MTSPQMELGLNLGLPQDAVDVNGRVWFRDLDGNRAVFVDQDPFYCYRLDDPVLHRFCAVQLVEAGLVKVREICPAFEIHDRAFSRYRSRFRNQGIAGLVPDKVGRKPLDTAPLWAGQKLLKMRRLGEIGIERLLRNGLDRNVVNFAGKAGNSGRGGLCAGSRRERHRPLF